MPFEVFEDLLPLVIFILIPLIQWIRLQFRRRPEEPDPSEPPARRPRPVVVREFPTPPGVPAPVPPTPIPPRPESVSPTARVRPTRAERRPRPAVVPTGAARTETSPAPPPRPSAPPRTQRFDYARVLHDPVGLQRAVALMTILGPCRALSPYVTDEPH